MPGKASECRTQSSVKNFGLSRFEKVSANPDPDKGRATQAETTDLRPATSTLISLAYFGTGVHFFVPSSAGLCLLHFGRVLPSAAVLLGAIMARSETVENGSTAADFNGKQGAFILYNITLSPALLFSDVVRSLTSSCISQLRCRSLRVETLLFNRSRLHMSSQFRILTSLPRSYGLVG